MKPKPTKEERAAIRAEWRAEQAKKPGRPEQLATLPAAEELVVVNSRGESHEEEPTPRKPRAPKATYRPRLAITAGFDANYGQTSMQVTERMSEGGGGDRHGAFVDAAIRAGMLSPTSEGQRASTVSPKK